MLPGPTRPDRPSTRPGTAGTQPALFTPDDDPLAVDLREVTFTVLDLETTGGSPDTAGITEVAAVKVRGGEPLGELATLVNPGVPLPAFITALTGITPAMVADAPPVRTVLPNLLEFLRGTVLVAHNAPYDVGFLRAACRAHAHPWPEPQVLDTVTLARRVLSTDEVTNRRLATLAAHFRTTTRPRHRALDDARATVEVLHGLIARLAGFGVRTLRDTVELCAVTDPVRRRRRGLADGLPHAPGVYLFRGGDDRVLYVGMSGDIATRVRGYFTTGERRRRITEMLAAAERVEAVTCAHALEARVRELRLIAEHAPPYNRRSRHTGPGWWLKLTDEPYPRLSLVRAVGADADRVPYLGPFPRRRAAETVADAVHDAVPLRRCTQRLSTRRTSPACVLADLGRCPAPCRHAVAAPDYREQAAAPVRAAFTGDPAALVTPLRARLARLADAGRYEDAAVVRTRLAALLRAVVTRQRRAGLARIAELCAARPAGGGWELAVIRHGRLAAAGYAPPGQPPRAVLASVRAGADTGAVAGAGAATGGDGGTAGPDGGPGTATGGGPGAAAEETDRLLDWLELPETRLVEASTGWVSPVAGAARFAPLLADLDAAARPG